MRRLSRLGVNAISGQSPMRYTRCGVYELYKARHVARELSTLPSTGKKLGPGIGNGGLGAGDWWCERRGRALARDNHKLQQSNFRQAAVTRLPLPP